MAKPVWSVERTGVCVTDHRGHKQPQVVATDTPTSGTAACLSGRGGGVATSISRNGITYETATASPAGTRLQSGFTNRGCNRYGCSRASGRPLSEGAVSRSALSLDVEHRVVHGNKLRRSGDLRQAVGELGAEVITLPHQAREEGGQKALGELFSAPARPRRAQVVAPGVVGSGGRSHLRHARGVRVLLTS